MKRQPLRLFLLLALLAPWAAKAQTGNISFADANVKAICVRSTTGWDTNGDGELSYAEAAAVTSLGTVFVDAFQQVGTSVTFNELQYFTGLTSINNDAFSGCRSLATVTLPPSVQTIGESSFHGCNSLSSIEIPNSVISIGTEAFRSCGALTSITIPSSVTSIGENPFFFCPALASITVEAGNTVYSSPEGSNAIIKTNEHKLVSGCKNTVIPDGVTTIGASAFVGCSGLTEINIPSSVTLIDAWAFSNCSGLIALTIPSSVSYIGDVAFDGCINLTEMTVLATTPPYLDGDVFGEVNPDIPIYVPMGNLTDYQNYNNSYYEYTSWGNFTNFFGIVTIGDEASNYTHYTLPVNMYYNYSLTQQIYTAEEIGTTGAITSIAFDYINTLPFTTEGMKVYMKNVDKTTFDSDTDMVDLSDATLVYDGNFAASGAGWVRLQLQTPFYYDGNSDLLLCCYDPTDGYLGYQIIFRQTTTDDNYTALTYHSDLYNPDINNISSFDGEKYRLKYRNNIYFAINPNIQFADAAVKAICVDNWDTNGDGELSYAEAAAVTTLTPNGTNNYSAFRGKPITSFDELQYFTGLTSIEPYAFYNCTSLTSVTIGNSVTSIGSYAFGSCSGLTSVTIPDSVTSIGSAAFDNCSGLTSVTIGNSVTSIGAYAFYNCSGLTSVTIGNSVTSIGDSAFNHCTSLTSVTIGNSVTSIGNSAFYNCSGLTSVTIGNSVTSIGDSAFNHCTSLTSVTIPASVTSIGSNPFAYCDLLESITVDPGNTVYSSPNGCNAIIKTADHLLVLGCKNTVIPNDVTTIYGSAFYGCIGLTSIEIPASVSNIYTGAFARCSNLEEIRVWAVTPPATFTLCFNYVPTDIPVYVPMGSLADYQNYNNSYGYTSWGNFTNFIGIVTIGDETSINTDYTLPVNMDYNYSLSQQIYTAEEIGTTGALTSIAFDYTNTLPFTTEGMKVYMKNVDKTTFDSDTDMVDLSDATLVYDGTFAASGAGWVSLQLQTPFYYDGNSNLLLCCYDPTDGYLGNEIEFRLTTTGDNYTALTYFSDEYNPDINDISSFAGVKYRIKNRNNIYLAINPNIQFADAAVKAICVDNWDSNGDGELSYAEAAAVTSLGEVFKNNDNITSFNELQYFTGLTSINNDAFSGCWSLAAVTLPPTVQAIGEFSFYGCNFPSFVIPNSVTSIGSHAFRSCGALTSITIPSSMTSIGENPFFSCPALASITVESGNSTYYSPEYSNTIIETNTSKLIVGCKNTVIPEGVTTIGASAFGGCSSLTEIHIPSSVTRIDAWAFKECSGLTALTIPSSVTYIGDEAFNGCTGLTEMTVLATTPPSLDNDNVFGGVNLDIPVYVPCGSLEAYQNYNNTGTPWGGFTNIHDLCENPLCVAPTNVEVTSTEPQNGYNGFTFSFTPGHEEQTLWSFYVSEDYELPATYQEMVANGWLGSTNQTVGSYYPTDEDELAMEGTTYYLWVGYNCGTEGDPDIVWSEGPTMVTIPSEIVYNLTSGVNWWAPLAPITLGELKSQLYGIPVVINSQNEGFLFGEDNWSGTLSKSDDYIIQPGEMYKIVIKDDSSKDVYVFAVPQTWANVELQHGYNWFGYTGNAETIADAIGPNSPPTNGDKIIDENGHVATYQDGSWTGDLTHLYKGHGYVYYSAADNIRLLYLQ